MTRSHNKRHKLPAHKYSEEFIEMMNKKLKKHLARNDKFIKDAGHSDTINELEQVLKKRPPVVKRSEFGYYLYNAHLTLEASHKELKKQLTREVLNDYTVKQILYRIAQTLDILRPAEVKLTRWQKIKVALQGIGNRILSIKKSY